jgi:glucose-1-phosphate adenylyltransferase
MPFGGICRIIDFTLSNCLDSGLARVAVLTQYQHDHLQRYVRQRWSGLWNRPGQDSQLMCLAPTSGKRYRGTADAVFQNLSLLESSPKYVVILSGDHVYEMDYRELFIRHLETNADVTIATIEHPLKTATQFGVVEVDSNFRVTGFEEKPSDPLPLPLRPDMALISMGLYVFKTDILVQALVENCEGGLGFDFGHHVIPSLISSARVYAYDFRDEVEDSPRYWRDIGTLDSYHEASMDLIRGKVRSPGLPLRNRVSIRASARVSHSVLSYGVRVEECASIEESIVMPGATVGRGAQVRRAIIEEGVHIPDDFQVGMDIEHDREHYTVSRNGIVVVSNTSRLTKSVVVRFQVGQVPRAKRTVA